MVLQHVATWWSEVLASLFFNIVFNMMMCIHALLPWTHKYRRGWLKNRLKWQILQPAHKMPPSLRISQALNIRRNLLLIQAWLVCLPDYPIRLPAITYMDLDSICILHLHTVLISFSLRREDCLSHEPCPGHSWQVTLVWVCSVYVLGLGGLTFKCNQHWDSLIATGQSATTSTDYD